MMMPSRLKHTGKTITMTLQQAPRLCYGLIHCNVNKTTQCIGQVKNSPQSGKWYLCFEIDKKTASRALTKVIDFILDIELF